MSESYESFIESVKEQADVGVGLFAESKSGIKSEQLIVAFYNVPEGKRSSTNNSNNRALFTVNPTKNGKFKLEALVSYFDSEKREYIKLRAKTATLDKLASYLAAHISKLSQCEPVLSKY